MWWSIEEQEKTQRQIEAMRLVAAKICKSRESAHQFLIDAGIIKERKKRKSSETKK